MNLESVIRVSQGLQMDFNRGRDLDGTHESISSIIFKGKLHRYRRLIFKKN